MLRVLGVLCVGRVVAVLAVRVGDVRIRVTTSIVDNGAQGVMGMGVRCVRVRVREGISVPTTSSSPCAL